MTQIATDLRNTIDEARRFRYQPTLPITATNMQDAIDQGISIPKTMVPTLITLAMSPYTPTNNDIFLAVDTSAGPVTINLQPAAARFNIPLEIKDNTGNAAANPISVVPSGAETVDGLAPYPMDSAYAAVRLIPEGGKYGVAS